MAKSPHTPKSIMVQRCPQLGSAFPRPFPQHWPVQCREAPSPPVLSQEPHFLNTCGRTGQVLEFLDLESLHGHGLALVAGAVDDGTTATLAQDAALVFTVL